MANSIGHTQLPYPIYASKYTTGVPFWASDGTPTDPTTPDTEISKDGGTFADCTEEVTTVSGTGTGQGYITFTAAEMTCDIAQVAAKAASGPKTTPMELRPRRLAILGSGTLSAGSAGGGTLPSGFRPAYDISGCFIRTNAGTGPGQARKIMTYVTSTGAFTIAPNWEVTVSTDTTFDVLLPEGVVANQIKSIPQTGDAFLIVNDGTNGNAAIRAKLFAGVEAITVSDKTGYRLSATGVLDVWDVDKDDLDVVDSIGKQVYDRLAAIQAKSDQLIFSSLASSTFLRVDVRYQNNTLVLGTGVSGDLWRG